MLCCRSPLGFIRIVVYLFRLLTGEVVIALPWWLRRGNRHSPRIRRPGDIDQFNPAIKSPGIWATNGRHAPSLRAIALNLPLDELQRRYLVQQFLQRQIWSVYTRCYRHNCLKLR
ncbi:hypothetical protein EI94DRAFT_1725329 [Lactarius quietus]|nr:hypothetical protein EI94DRAFT_1725329 [Lactarius quietus]